jgi:hypothetical protein
MKNQYFGDICDYLKYGLLRTIGRETGLRTGVCWMLTEDDGRTDGGKTRYLDQHHKWRKHDPELFDTLQAAIQAGQRHVRVAETGGIVPGAIYHSDLLADNRACRQVYFEKLSPIATSCDLLFFDPDNGMGVPSKPLGSKGSSKYLYWEEAAQLARRGKSLIVFQHFARVKRDIFMAELQGRFQQVTGSSWIGVLETANVAYFIVAAQAHEQALRAACGSVARQWHPHIRMLQE